ncbi:MAG TPA: diacylglycerol kinase family protein [Polyangiales bacterium]|nr:diacylglycerol kinase family protein [Polyangiales bacterium]
MHAPAAIIINRNAGELRRDARLIDRMRERAGYSLPVHVTDDLPALRALCERLVREGVSSVGVVGGDGTASATLTALWRACGDKPLPRIALLRGGSMNTVANSLGTGRGSVLQLLERLNNVLRSPELQRTCSRPVICVNRQRLGFLFGTGVWYGYLAETYRSGPPSFPIYVSVLGRLFASAAVNGEMVRRIVRPAATGVQFRAGAWPSQAYLSIAAGTVADVGFGVKPFHRAFASEDCFQLLAITGNARDVLRAMPDLRLGRGFEDRVARQVMTDYAELRPEQGFIEYSVDGDIDTLQGSLTLEIGPRIDFLRL